MNKHGIKIMISFLWLSLIIFSHSSKLEQFSSFKKPYKAEDDMSVHFSGLSDPSTNYINLGRVNVFKNLIKKHIEDRFSSSNKPPNKVSENNKTSEEINVKFLNKTTDSTSPIKNSSQAGVSNTPSIIFLI
jgi:hypothetical protein